MNENCNPSVTPTRAISRPPTQVTRSNRTSAPYGGSRPSTIRDHHVLHPHLVPQPPGQAARHRVGMLHDEGVRHRLRHDVERPAQCSSTAARRSYWSTTKRRMKNSVSGDVDANASGRQSTTSARPTSSTRTTSGGGSDRNAAARRPAPDAVVETLVERTVRLLRVVLAAATAPRAALRPPPAPSSRTAGSRSGWRLIDRGSPPARRPGPAPCPCAGPTPAHPAPQAASPGPPAPPRRNGPRAGSTAGRPP